jgi:FkbM family methyltransferase
VVNLVRPQAVFHADVQRKILGCNSQYFEDIFIDSIFRGKRTGTYVDVGANDPSEFSNTKRFYDRGWSGVNIEPDVKVFEKICRERQRDVNLNLGIGRQEGELTFYALSPNTLSTFSKRAALHSISKDGATIMSETRVKVITLAELFRNTVADRQVDFLSVDAEGYEYEILSSNDCKLFRPTAIIVQLNQDKNGRVAHLMRAEDYLLICFNGTNGIFVDGHSPEMQSYMQI